MWYNYSSFSFRSASLDVEPIYTFRAHMWVFDIIDKYIVIHNNIFYPVGSYQSAFFSASQ